jgi:nucleotide-binding universal stress UspA family protein
VTGSRELLVLGYDASPEAARAAGWALAAARARPGSVEVDLVRAVSLPPIPVAGWDIPVSELIESHEREARAETEAGAAGFRAAGVAAAVVLRRWLPAETLVEHAAARRASLVVVGQRGDRPGRLLLGSTSRGVVLHAAAPIAVVRGERVEAPPALVIAALDGSPASERALAAARRWWPAAAIAAVHVRGGGAPVDRDSLGASVERAGLDPDRLEMLLLDGDPAASLLDLTEGRSAALLTLGRGGMGAFASRLLGSVADKLIQIAPCPVLVAP